MRRIDASTRSLRRGGRPYTADGQLAQGDRAEAQADQGQHRVVERLEHAADLAVVALVQGQVDQRDVAADRDDPELAGRRAPLLEPHPAQDLLDRVGPQPPPQRRPVGLLDAEARMGEDVRGLAVVGHQQDAAGVVIEPPDRDDARRHTGAAHEIADRAPPFRIAQRGDDADRLVDDLVGARGVGAHRFPVDLDPRALIDLRAELAHDLPRDPHPPGDDHLFRAAARRDAGRREELLEPQTFFRSNAVMNSSFVWVRASAA